MDANEKDQALSVESDKLSGSNDESTEKIKDPTVQVLQHELTVEMLKKQLLALHPTRWQTLRRGLNVTVVGAFFAAILPVTTAIEGYFEKHKQLVIDAQKERQEIADKYLDRLKDTTERLRTLRFIAATAIDIDMRKWAQDELPGVEKELARLDQETADLVAQADLDEKAYQKLLDAQTKIATSGDSKATPGGPAARETAELEAARARAHTSATKAISNIQRQQSAMAGHRK